MVTVSHPTGNANLRAALDGLEAAGLLECFYTAIATFPGNTFDKLGQIGPFNDFNRRAYSPALEIHTHLFPWLELGRLLATRLGLKRLTRHETGPLSVDAIYRSLDKRVANRLRRKRTQAIYAYEDGAAYSFEVAKQLGLSTLYDLPIGYWRASRKLLGQVATDHPDWAMTIKGMQDSEEKLARKDREIALADHIYVASSFTAKTLEDYPEQLPPVSVIPYGFPTPVTNRKYENAQGRPLRLLFVGGLSQRKGLLEMFQAIAPFGKRIELTVIGRLPEEACPPLNEYLAKHRYIESLPHREILRTMQQHDVLLFPSHFEGFGLVITEAMSQGTPVITTERTAGPDLITQGQDGYVVPAGSAEAISELLEELLVRPQTVAELGRAAVRTAAGRPWSKYGYELATSVAQQVTRYA
ncbi:glycosyltransferase involved in cell wall biosynthesis [Neolewinella xylanilytica]|uniref:Glycosyltransferase involved in cell wall biosynthesis n=1 Tax=Neolewinella xylanilytica TaxID=1514080 RepID=A0A2S6I7V2_9BACT|nr:glycosyltransferase family 4 protein [Neolewinella xylanilytica]PPK87529.1 glycosyltransferase involved in cell wall biosynthesis [Neolewinella xylanilytica]